MIEPPTLTDAATSARSASVSAPSWPTSKIWLSSVTNRSNLPRSASTRRSPSSVTGTVRAESRSCRAFATSGTE